VVERSAEAEAAAERCNIHKENIGSACRPDHRFPIMPDCDCLDADVAAESRHVDCPGARSGLRRSIRWAIACVIWRQVSRVTFDQRPGMCSTLISLAFSSAARPRDLVARSIPKGWAGSREARISHSQGTGPLRKRLLLYVKLISAFSN